MRWARSFINVNYGFKHNYSRQAERGLQKFQILTSMWVQRFFLQDIQYALLNSHDVDFFLSGFYMLKVTTIISDWTLVPNIIHWFQLWLWTGNMEKIEKMKLCEANLKSSRLSLQKMYIFEGSDIIVEYLINNI